MYATLLHKNLRAVGLMCFLGWISSGLSFSQTSVNGAAGWKQFNGEFFSFLYPPAWTLTTNGATEALARESSPDGLFRVFEIEYLTAFGSDHNRLFASEQEALRQLAASAGG